MAKKKTPRAALNGLYRSVRYHVQGLTDVHPTQMSIKKCVEILVNHYGLQITASKENAAEIVRQIKELKVPRPTIQKKKEPKQNFNAFYDTWEWKKVRYEALKKYGAKCQCCGATKENAKIVVDHIKPIRFHWDLRLEQSNLQILCDDCNKGKSYQDTTDWREKK